MTGYAEPSKPNFLTRLRFRLPELPRPPYFYTQLGYFCAMDALQQALGTLCERGRLCVVQVERSAHGSQRQPCVKQVGSLGHGYAAMQSQNPTSQL